MGGYAGADERVAPRGTKRYLPLLAGLNLRITEEELDARFDVDEAERFVLDVCQGALDMPRIAEQLSGFAKWTSPCEAGLSGAGPRLVRTGFGPAPGKVARLSYRVRARPGPCGQHHTYPRDPNRRP